MIQDHLYKMNHQKNIQFSLLAIHYSIDNNTEHFTRNFTFTLGLGFVVTSASWIGGDKQ